MRNKKLPNEATIKRGMLALQEKSDRYMQAIDEYWSAVDKQVQNEPAEKPKMGVMPNFGNSLR